MCYERAVELRSEQLKAIDTVRKNLVRLHVALCQAKAGTKYRAVADQLTGVRKEYQNLLALFVENAGVNLTTDERLVFDPVTHRIIPTAPEPLTNESFVTGREIRSTVTLAAFFGKPNSGAAKQVKRTIAGRGVFVLMQTAYEEVLLNKIDRQNDMESIKRLRAYIGRFNSTFPQYMEYGLKSAPKR